MLPNNIFKQRPNYHPEVPLFAKKLEATSDPLLRVQLCDLRVAFRTENSRSFSLPERDKQYLESLLKRDATLQTLITELSPAIPAIKGIFQSALIKFTELSLQVRSTKLNKIEKEALLPLFRVLCLETAINYLIVNETREKKELTASSIFCGAVAERLRQTDTDLIFSIKELLVRKPRIAFSFSREAVRMLLKLGEHPEISKLFSSSQIKRTILCNQQPLKHLEKLVAEFYEITNDPKLGKFVSLDASVHEPCKFSQREIIEIIFKNPQSAKASFLSACQLFERLQADRDLAKYFSASYLKSAIISYKEPRKKLEGAIKLIKELEATPEFAEKFTYNQIRNVVVQRHNKAEAYLKKTITLLQKIKEHPDFGSFFSDGEIKFFLLASHSNIHARLKKVTQNVSDLQNKFEDFFSPSELKDAVIRYREKSEEHLASCQMEIANNLKVYAKKYPFFTLAEIRAVILSRFKGKEAQNYLKKAANNLNSLRKLYSVKLDDWIIKKVCLSYPENPQQMLEAICERYEDFKEISEKNKIFSASDFARIALQNESPEIILKAISAKLAAVPKFCPEACQIFTPSELKVLALKSVNTFENRLAQAVTVYQKKLALPAVQNNLTPECLSYIVSQHLGTIDQYLSELFAHIDKKVRAGATESRQQLARKIIKQEAVVN